MKALQTQSLHFMNQALNSLRWVIQPFGLYPWTIALQNISSVWFGILWCAQRGRGDVCIQPCASQCFWREESLRIVNGSILTLQPPGCHCSSPVFFSFPWGFNMENALQFCCRILILWAPKYSCLSWQWEVLRGSSLFFSVRFWPHWITRKALT